MNSGAIVTEAAGTSPRAKRYEVLNQAVDAWIAGLGGAERVASAVTETIKATGARRHPGWGNDPSTPEAVAEFEYTLLQDLVRPRYNLTFGAQTHLVPAKLQYNEVGNGSIGSVDGVDFMFNPKYTRASIPSWRVATRQRHFDMTSPLRMLRKVQAPGADVTLDGHPAPGGGTSVLTLREVGRPPVRLFLDETSGRLVKLETVENHSPLGDTLVEVCFRDYRSTSGLSLPYNVTVSVGGTLVHDESRTLVETSTTVSDESFVVLDVPRAAAEGDGTLEQAAYAQYSTEWILNYVYAGVVFYFDLQVAPVVPAPVEVANGVKIVLGPSHNVLVVEMPDYLLAVEAPLYDEYTRAALAQVKASFPGKPFRTVVATHFHYDHVGGVREFAAEGGLTVICGEPTVPFFEQVFRGPHAVDPDRFQSNPEPVKVVGVRDTLSLPTADGGEMRLIRIQSDHSKDMLIVYLSKAKLVFESDLWNPTPSMPPARSGRGRLATQLYDAIVARNLDVELVVGGHRGSDGKAWAHVAPLSFLKMAAGR
jgi:glyoxylase-like metal-dependent hydrolase (beta-lactamase superfamily II)